MSEITEILGFPVLVTEACPEGEAWLVSPKYTPTGELDVEATRKASVRMVNLATTEPR